MKQLKIYLTVMIAAFFMSSCNSQEQSSGENEDNAPKSQISPLQIVEDINVKDFREKLEKDPNALVLDVRTPSEFAEGSIEGAINVDFLNENFSTELDQLDKNRTIYLYCKSGGRSGQAKKILEDKGFTAIYNLEGGYMAWLR